MSVTETDTTEHPAVVLLRKAIARHDTIDPPHVDEVLDDCAADMADDPEAWRKHLRQQHESLWLVAGALHAAGQTVRAAFKAGLKDPQACVDIIGEDLADLGQLDESMWADTEPEEAAAPAPSTVDAMTAASIPAVDLARRLADVRASTERVVYLEHAKRIRDEAVAEVFHKGQLHGYDAAQAEGKELIAAERANYDGALADLAALVDVARRAMTLAADALVVGGTSYVADALAELRGYLDDNHRQEVTP